MSTTLTPKSSSFDAGFSGHRGLRFVRGEGAFVEDSDGRRYMDATSMYGVTALGHSHPALVGAISRQAERRVSCFASYGNDSRDALLELLHRRLQPLDRFFMCNSGTEAVEAAIKVARATTGKRGVVALSGAFHGRTMGALSATFRGSHRDAFQPLLPNFVHVRPGDRDGLCESITGETGMVIVETVQGEGGVRVIGSSFLREARELAQAHGALFAVDEVQTGLGRTGRWFGHEHAQLEPDLVCLAKALGGGVPIGALAMRSDLEGMKVGFHGSTFGGNPLACAAAAAVFETIESEGLVARAADHGARLFDRLQAGLQPTPSGKVREVRGQGLMIGIELRESAIPIQRRLQQRGFLVLGAGPRVLRLLPPLVTTWEDLSVLAQSVIEEVQR